MVETRFHSHLSLFSYNCTNLMICKTIYTTLMHKMISSQKMIMSSLKTIFLTTYFLVILCVTNSTVIAADTGLQVEVEALTTFKKVITNDPLDSLLGWNSSSHHCNWTGVTCDPTTRNVISISLIKLQLQGVVSSFLGNLSKLQVLDLSSNAFFGEIPSELANCYQLSELTLFNNSFSGIIPPELGNLQNLESLDLGNNFLNGSIPDSITNCTALGALGLNSNNLTGKIPSNIGNLASLRVFVGYTNGLDGPIPDTIGRLTALRVLDLSQNKLSGEIPAGIGNLKSLETVQLFENSFFGEIPPEIGQCKNLTLLNMYSNNFRGRIPEEFGNLANLKQLRLYKNKLTSIIPKSLFNCKSLTHLEISVNELSGEIPSEIESLQSLEMLMLHSNNFSGSIPSSLTNLKNLTYFSASFNLLTGAIPSDIGKLYNLMNLTLNNNLLSGSLPSSITNCTQLLAVSLSYNSLTGELPRGLGQLSEMTFFSVGNNSMFGNLPDDLFDCSSLETLDLSRNNFSGPLKPSIGNMSNLRRLQLHSNSLTGHIPPEISKLSRLFTVQIGKNRLSGRVPRELSKLSLLQDISLNDNALEGEIPEPLFQLKQLTILELQNNQLSGRVSDSLSKLELLSILNLSGNKFQGFIPSSMAKLTRLTMLDLSHNNFSGSVSGLFLASMKGLQSYLNLSHNSFSEKIPEEIGKLDMVQSIDLSNNNFSGQVPPTLRGCRNLLNLDLSVNQISGPVHEETFDEPNPLTSINLSRNHINGQIPASLAKQTYLNSLDLSQNQLDGEIPEKLSEMSSLKFLNLSYNQLEGAIPQSGVLQKFPASSFAGNKGLCGTKSSGSCNKRSNSGTLHQKTLLILIPLVCASVLLCIALVTLIYKLKKRSQTRRIKEVETPEDDNAAALKLKRFESKEMEIATDNFSETRVLGSSNLSMVYQGRLDDGQIVAVKKLNLVQFAEESNKCFYREAKILSQLRHRNLVKVIGYAWESRKLKALVLEYMENGNLDKIIHDPSVDRSKWTLLRRVEVCISIAKGLVYLHSGYDFPIIHCDLKPSNVLLDGDWEAHVSDFGTARMLGVHLPSDRSNTTASAFTGTIGYIAPEFAYMRTLTTKVDIFSFGVIIMEFLTKQRPTSLTEEVGSSGTLRHLVEKAIAADKPLGVIDPALTSSLKVNEEDAVQEILKLALSCTSMTPEDRPDMNSVLSYLLKLETAIRCQNHHNTPSKLVVT